MPAQTGDRFPNVIKTSVSMSGANTLTFQEINIGLNLFDKVGLIVHRIHYVIPRADLVLVVDAADDLAVALTLSNSVSSISPTERSTVDFIRLQTDQFGVAASAELFKNPLVHDFSTLPGGGILIPPRPLYLAETSTSLASAASAQAMIFFTIHQLKDSDYYELLETYRFFE